MEEFARGMGQREHNAARMDEEAEYVLRMEHRRNHAAKGDVETKLSMEECASDMGQGSSDAAVKDVEIELEQREFV